MKNGQSRQTGNIGYTRHRKKTIQTNWQHWLHKTQGEDNPDKKHNTENLKDEQHEPHQKPRSPGRASSPGLQQDTTMLFYENSITISAKHKNRIERYEIMDDMDSTNTTGSVP